MKVASVAHVKAHFSAYLRQSEQGPIVVTRNGTPVAVLLALGDQEELEQIFLAHSPRLRKPLDAARRRINAGGGIAHEEFWREVGSDPS